MLFRSAGLDLSSYQRREKKNKFIFFLSCKSESINLPTREHTAMKKFIYSLVRKRNQRILSVGKSELMVVLLVNC